MVTTEPDFRSPTKKIEKKTEQSHIPCALTSLESAAQTECQ